MANTNPFPANDHDAVLQLWPRVANLEAQEARMQDAQNRLDAAIDGLRGEMTRLREDLGARIESSHAALRVEMGDRLTALDAHLERQDGQQADLRETVAGARGHWPDAAIIAVSTGATLVAAFLAAVLAHVHW